MTDSEEMLVARRRLVNAIHKATTHITLEHATEVDNAWNAYDASVRAETLREVRGVIADVKAGGEDFADNADEKFGWDQACDCVHNSLALKDTLDALAQPEGTE